LGLCFAKGVRSFQAATMLRTEVSGERGEVCGRRRGDAVGVPVKVAVPVKVSVGVNVFENVSVYVLVKVLGL